MKAKAQKPVRRARKKPVATKPTKVARNGVSSPYGYRVVEMEWMNKHPEKLRPYAGEYVVVEGRRIVSHSENAALAVEEARRQGLTNMFILFLEPPLPPNTFRIGGV
jgi:Family of unknown function (DUF5678)